MWFNMMTSDQRSRCPSKILTDGRVAQFWDEGRVLGTWYGKSKNFGSNDVVWDAFFVYGSQTKWADQPSGLIAWGSAIISNRTQLAEAVANSVGR